MAGKGGKRPGAGRKPSTLRGIVKRLPKDCAEIVLVTINASEKWIALANSSDERIQLDTLKYLTDRAYGKPRQDTAVMVSPGEGVRGIEFFYGSAKK